MSWPLGLEQNQDRIKCLNFKWVHQLHPYGSYLPLPSTCNHFWPNSRCPARSQLFWGVFLALPKMESTLGLLRLSSHEISHLNLQSQEKEEHMQGLVSRGWTYACWSNFGEPPPLPEGHALPFVAIAEEIDFSHDFLWYQRAFWCFLLGLGGLYPTGLCSDT